MYITNDRVAQLVLSDLQLKIYFRYREKYENLLVDYDLKSHILTFTPLDVVKPVKRGSK